MTEAVADLRVPSIRTAATPTRLVTAAAFVAAALFLLPEVFGAFWMQIMFQWALYSAVALGLGLLVGRTGMFSLCQIPLLAAGAWMALRVFQAQWQRLERTHRCLSTDGTNGSTR